MQGSLPVLYSNFPLQKVISNIMKQNSDFWWLSFYLQKIVQMRLHFVLCQCNCAAIAFCDTPVLQGGKVLPIACNLLHDTNQACAINDLQNEPLDLHFHSARLNSLLRSVYLLFRCFAVWMLKSSVSSAHYIHN